MENNIFIVAIKKDDKYYYIGKTSTPQEKNIPTNSDLTYQYHNSTIRNVFKEGVRLLI